MGRRVIVAAVIVALAAAGCSTGSQPGPAADRTPAGTPTTAAAPPASTDPGPAPGLRDWIYLVGTEMRPGIYTTTVPADHGHPCYWARLRSFGQPGSVIAEGNPEPGQTVQVTVLQDDRGFKVSNGCTWQPAQQV
ncbi:hypothetical protein V6U90_07985 [Micromonospora sp. CPCC 206060]|uniref:hypothetical protein n=1 Tax=Micromonospora sp. CPCC 206060 TaxID=3122406 RepID=UPI002FF411D2